jgi:hypothetical protein
MLFQCTETFGDLTDSFFFKTLTPIISIRHSTASLELHPVARLYLHVLCLGVCDASFSQSSFPIRFYLLDY